jgi:hypothetical protein
MVNITLRVLTKPKWEKLPEIYKKLGTDYDQRVLPSIVNEVLKGVVVRANRFSFLILAYISSSPSNRRPASTLRSSSHKESW